MEKHLDELCALNARANALSEMGVHVENKLTDEDRAKLEYKALKDHLANSAQGVRATPFYGR